MNSRRDDPELSAADISPVTTIDASDGRVARRQRNMAAVQSAVLDLMEEGEQPTLAAIARRAGVATRSVYRYFGDAEAAVRDAVEARRDRVTEVFESEPCISSNAPLAERLGMVVLRRLRLDRLIEPLDGSGGVRDLPALLDAEVRAAFAPELDAGDEELALVLCGLFRLSSVRAMRDVFVESDQEIAAAMMRVASAMVADSRTSA